MWYDAHLWIVCMYTYTYVCMYAYIHSQTFILRHACMHKHTNEAYGLNNSQQMLTVVVLGYGIMEDIFSFFNLCKLIAQRGLIVIFSYMHM